MKKIIYCYIGIIVAGVIGAVIIFSSISSDTWKDWRTDNVGVTRPDELNEQINCLSNGGVWKNTSCNFEPMHNPDPNTVLIYPITDASHTFTTIIPHSIIIYLEKDNKVTWVNKTFFTATVYGINGTWSTGEISPSMQKSIQFNSTGFYDYQADTAYEGNGGEIIALSNETNSLPVDIRMKMGMSIVSGYLENDPELIGVGIGSTEKGVMITINQEALAKHDDAELFYFNMYKALIPFDVPITIDFSSTEDSPSIPENLIENDSLREKLFSNMTYQQKLDLIQMEIESKNFKPFSRVVISNLKDSYDDKEKITFNLITFGLSNWCIFPKLSVYVENLEKPLYTYQVDHHCPPPTETPHREIESFTEKNFPAFPTCQFSGWYTIVAESFEFGPQKIDKYYCNVNENVGK
jgi:hypothetical protein